MSVVSQMQAIIAIIEQYQLESVIHTESGSNPSVHLSNPNEMQKFEGVQVHDRMSIDYPTELSVVIDEVKVFVLVPLEMSVAS